jgi:ABC-2 type transport system ATP-binding protein
MKQNGKRDGGESQVKNIVLMEGLSSREYFWAENKNPRPVLEDIHLIIDKGEAWGITGRSHYEIKLLLEIMANIRSYDKGRCVLIERGMLRHKRVILKHVFYMGNSDMIYNNMNVLEFLMFAMDRFNSDKVALQEQIFEFMIQRGLGRICLTPNSLLTKEEKAVVTLIAAAYSDSVMIVFNFPQYDFDEILVEAIERISSFIRDRGKSLIIGTQNDLLIEKACSHTAFLLEGKILYQGNVEQLRLSYDKIEVIIRDKDIHSLQAQLTPLLAEYKLTVREDSLLISSLEDTACDPASIYKKIAEAGIVPEYMEVNPKTVYNAYEEIVLRHDLQK